MARIRSIARYVVESTEPTTRAQIDGLLIARINLDQARVALRKAERTELANLIQALTTSLQGAQGAVDPAQVAQQQAQYAAAVKKYTEQKDALESAEDTIREELAAIATESKRELRDALDDQIERLEAKAKEEEPRGTEATLKDLRQLRKVLVGGAGEGEGNKKKRRKRKRAKK
jgi:hypothetical protein